VGRGEGWGTEGRGERGDTDGGEVGREAVESEEAWDIAGRDTVGTEAVGWDTAGREAVRWDTAGRDTVGRGSSAEMGGGGGKSSAMRVDMAAVTASSPCVAPICSSRPTCERTIQRGVNREVG